MSYLSKSVLNGFDKYKYTSVDTSPISNYITHPFWNQVVKLCPTWVPPNALTLSGFLFLVLNFVILTYFDNHFYASSGLDPYWPPVPSWFWLAAAICIFLAHTLDGIDGKQARRTGTSGPLGELFDHGLDSWATLFLPLGMYSVFGRGEHSIDPYRMLFVLFGVMFTFAVSHWEKYNTGVLFLPWGYDISQIGMTVLYIATYYGGHELWRFNVPFVNQPFAQLFETLMHLSMFALSLPMSLWNVYKSYRDRTGKMRGFVECMRPLVPVFILFLFTLAWVHHSKCDILLKQPRLFYVAVGTVFSNITCRMIVNGMSGTRCEVFNWLLVPLIAIVGLVWCLNLAQYEVLILWAYTIFTVFAHIHYGIKVVQELAEHLNIYAFSVKRPPAKLKTK